MAGYHLYALFVGLFIPQIHNAWHLLFVISLLFLTRRTFFHEDQSKIPVRDIVLALLGVMVFAYVVVEYKDLINRAVSPNKVDITMGMHTLLPIVLLIIFLVTHMPIVRAALYSIVAMVVFAAKPEYRMYPKKIAQALIEGGLNVLPVAAACATASIVVGVLELTGGHLSLVIWSWHMREATYTYPLSLPC